MAVDVAQLRAQTTLLYRQARQWMARVPMKARLVLALFFFAAVLMAIHTAVMAKDSSMHLKLQHGFHNAQLSVWIDGELAYSGRVSGSTKKKFGLIPTDSVQGSLSEIIPVTSGRHQIRVRIEPEDGAAEEDGLTGDFARNSERDLSVSARHSGLSLAWAGTSTAPAEASTSLGWLSRYASSLFLTLAGSVMSALTGYALRELPARLRSTSASSSDHSNVPQ